MVKFPKLIVTSLCFCSISLSHGSTKEDYDSLANQVTLIDGDFVAMDSDETDEDSKALHLDTADSEDSQSLKEKSRVAERGDKIRGIMKEGKYNPDCKWNHCRVCDNQSPTNDRGWCKSCTNNMYPDKDGFPCCDNSYICGCTYK